MLSELRALVAVDDKECPMTPEEEQTLLVEFVESRLSKAEGTRRTNADCAKDVTYMADRIQDKVCEVFVVPVVSYANTLFVFFAQGMHGIHGIHGIAN
jgi:hypothetical protein